MDISRSDITTTGTLRFWHGGLFKKLKTGLQYVGGEGRTFLVDVDELCWWFLEQMARKCGAYKKIVEIYYLMPHSTLDEGLKRVYNDKEVLEMAEVVLKHKALDLYVVHGVDLLEVIIGVPEEIVGVPEVSVGVPGAPTTSPIASHVRTSPRLNKSPTTKDKSPLNEDQQTPDINITTPTSCVIPQTLQTQNLDSTPAASKKAPTPAHKPLETTLQPPIIFETSRAAGEENSLAPETFDQDLPPDYHDFYDDRPKSPVPLKDLVGDSGSDTSDPAYEPESEGSDEELNDEEFEQENEDSEEEELGEEEEIPFELNEADSSDDELREARNKVKKRNAECYEIAQTIREQAIQGKFSAGATTSHQPLQNQEAGERNDPLSEYEESEEETHTPGNSDEEDGIGNKRKARGLLVSANTDWNSFVWKVGQRFTSREAFRDGVAQYAIAQGRNLCFVSSNKSKQQRMEAKCVLGCPFRVYGSWDNRRACFVVKSIDSEHTCSRNMVKNKQLKASWLAKQFLEIFKARPHWPAKELIETVRRVYRVVIKKTLTYRVKYHAHKMLHGSMKEHYNKLGRYLKAIQEASPETHIDLYTVPPKSKSSSPVFQRIFFCFDGLRRGWLEGCRKLLCVDACFLKTFLGGQLKSAIGRDANEQMYPVAWAVVEGENNNSWEWFFLNLQKSLELGDGAGLTLISDEHQVLILTLLPE
ncbi:CREB-binding protein [Bienertia sinuspersici]